MTARAMTVSQFEAEWECTPPGTDYQKWLNDFAKPNGVTIVPDPEPRPNFEAMTKWELIEWCYENYNRDRVVFSERYQYISRAIIDFANAIADDKGMGR